MKGEERLLFKPKAKKTLLSSHIVNSMNSNHHRTFNTCLCCSVVDIEAKTLASKDPVPKERKQRPQPCYLQPLVIGDFPLSFSPQINTLYRPWNDIINVNNGLTQPKFCFCLWNTKNRKSSHIGLEVFSVIEKRRVFIYLYIIFVRSFLKPIRENTVDMVPVRIGKRVEIK